MTIDQTPAGKDQSPRGVIKTAFATVAAMVLILALGFIGNRLNDIEEQLAYSYPLVTDSVGSLPADVVAKGRAVYVPAYSHIYARGGAAILLETTLSVRNTDPEHQMRLDRVRYFDGDGKPLRQLTDGPVVLAPMQTLSYLIEGRDRGGGSGANFVVEWSAADVLNRPIIEAAMIGPNGLSFKSRGEPIDRR